MKREVIRKTLIIASIIGAFALGKVTTPTISLTEIPANYISIEKTIPLKDVACWYTNTNGYITVELKDVTRQLDNWDNAAYTDVLENIPDVTETYVNNMVNMSQVADFTATETDLHLYLEDGSAYYWEK